MQDEGIKTESQIVTLATGESAEFPAACVENCPEIRRLQRIAEDRRSYDEESREYAGRSLKLLGDVACKGCGEPFKLGYIYVCDIVGLKLVNES